jgi:Flp pilus assembly protein TadG
MLVTILRRLRITWNAERGKSPSRIGRQRKGATAAEMAVAAPVVFAVILGIIEISRGLMVIHLLNNAAQAGCRAGIIEGQSTANIKTVVVNALSSTGISAESTTVEVNDGTKDASSAQVGDEITVIVSVPTSAVSWIPHASFLKTSLQGQYTMRRE